ncbi:MAG: chemotaxis protein CheR [Planctomycetes bacterium]|nr:chemotaxis protein CheR [Planctomycetota bacterium]
MEDLLERLGYRPVGFRRVRRRVLRRIERRIRELGLADLDAYRRLVEEAPAERETLDGLLSITISKFYRDRALFDHLRRDVLPGLARRHGRCWSAGCASGEEPYTVAILAPGIEIVATDRDPLLLARAREGLYRASSLKDLPAEDRARAFDGEGGLFRLRAEYRANVRFRAMDVRREMPEGPFDLVFCRYVAFTYFGDALQRSVLEGIGERLAPGGLLAIGRHETLPPAPPFHRAAKGLNLFTRATIKGS